ncbi:unnamed protein product [Schistocephalus solidus]|uniref:Serine/threonine-protein kinase NIM1 n=1 Tax=Schistocephalus solidus TaxID=70667 RepID=A0A183T667_SCHSO|nr:unnamed protein product [Schistocephalus solidus]
MVKIWAVQRGGDVEEDVAIVSSQKELLEVEPGSTPVTDINNTAFFGSHPIEFNSRRKMRFLPFRGRTVGQLRKAILECQQVKIPQRISESASSLIRQLLCRNPRSRPKAAEIITDATNAASKRQATSVTEMQPGVRSSTRKTDHWLSGQVFPKAYPPFRISSIPDVHEQVISCPMHDGTADCATHCLPSALQDTGGQSVKIELTRNPGNLLTVPSHFDITDSRPEDNRSQRSSIIPDASVRQSETEAARLLLHMGVPLEQFDVARCLEARSSITGAYRILLHKLHRLRRLSNLIVPAQEKSTPAELENLSVCSISEGLTTFKGSLIETLGWQNLSEEQEHNQMELGRRRVCSLL